MYAGYTIRYLSSFILLEAFCVGMVFRYNYCDGMLFKVR